MKILILLALLSSLEHAASYIQCKETEYFTRCKLDCPVGCDNIDNPPRCRKTGQCVPGCMCRQGYVRLHSNDPQSPCVKFSECLMANQGGGFAPVQNGRPGQAIASSYGKCNPEERWTSCKSPCPISCETRFQPPQCSLAGCQPGCECKPGYYRLDSIDPMAPCVTAEMCDTVDGQTPGFPAGGQQAGFNRPNNDACPDGSMPAGTCEGGKPCQFGYTCDREMCCRNLEPNQSSTSNGNPTFGSIIQEIAGTFLPTDKSGLGGGLFRPGKGRGGVYRPRSVLEPEGRTYPNYYMSVCPGCAYGWPHGR